MIILQLATTHSKVKMDQQVDQAYFKLDLVKALQQIMCSVLLAMMVALFVLKVALE